MKNLIQEKSFEFSIDIIKLYKNLISSNEFIISKQLLRCGTSIGANVEEALAVQSRKDFIAKISIASKEARETRYWLKLLQVSQLVKCEPENEIEKIDELIRILTSIVKSSQEKLKNNV
ncbi:MAG: four helix bundle protein [Ignavibacteriales bacterium]|nr:MAG: four helix bundle protein [Ignavibacteriales bacterium]